MSKYFAAKEGYCIRKGYWNWLTNIVKIHSYFSNLRLLAGEKDWKGLLCPNRRKPRLECIVLAAFSTPAPTAFQPELECHLIGTLLAGIKNGKLIIHSFQRLFSSNDANAEFEIIGWDFFAKVIRRAKVWEHWPILIVLYY